MLRLRAHMISDLLSGIVVTATVGFSIAFTLVLSRFMPMIDNPTGFFGYANVIMYLTIEGLFLFIVVYGAYIAVRKKEYKN